MNKSKENLKKAMLWHSDQDGKVKCDLCNHRCMIADGAVGLCRVRENINGTLYSLNYHSVVAANADYIEKKPLFHFQPGSMSFSIACPGCNFQCDFCQNWQISQAQIEHNRLPGQSLPPEIIVREALAQNCKSIAYTYTEPTIFMELCDDTARLAKQHNLTNVFVSNGYMTREAIDTVTDWLDGINVDLKSFSDDYYRKLCKSKLQPVLNTIEYIAKNTDIWMEITTLVLPEENDSDDELKAIADFIVEKAGPNVPWHISRFYPQYKHNSSYPTPVETIEKAYKIGKDAGLQYVYPGNMPGAKTETTFCHNCDKPLLQRSGFHLLANHIKDSRCPYCNEQIPGFQLDSQGQQ